MKEITERLPLRILVFGANGYVGLRLVESLTGQAGHEIFAFVRDAHRFHMKSQLSPIRVIEGDLLNPESLQKIPSAIDIVYYLVHGMTSSSRSFEEIENEQIDHCLCALSKKSIKQIIYLGGIVDKQPSSPHLRSRFHVEERICQSGLPYTALRAAIIIGAGSASFEIIRHLTEKLPFMITPKWVKNRCQPISIIDVVYYLQGVMGKKEALFSSFDIGGKDRLSFKEMMLQFARCRGLKRWIVTVPILTLELSSLWLFLFGGVNRSLAKSLVQSLKHQFVCTEERIKTIIPHECLDYTTSVRRAFEKIEQNTVISSWSDAFIRGRMDPEIATYIKVPSHGCMKKAVLVPTDAKEEYLKSVVWSIGGKNGWYYMEWAWRFRGMIDKLFGGIGLSRGRRSQAELAAGDALDFWRVLLADKKKVYLLLYAEMKLPGEAWLEFYVTHQKNRKVLNIIATFRPLGIWGRLYWYFFYPFHAKLFQGLAKEIVKRAENMK